MKREIVLCLAFFVLSCKEEQIKTDDSFIKNQSPRSHEKLDTLSSSPRQLKGATKSNRKIPIVVEGYKQIKFRKSMRYIYDSGLISMKSELFPDADNKKFDTYDEIVDYYSHTVQYVPRQYFLEKFKYLRNWTYWNTSMIDPNNVLARRGSGRAALDVYSFKDTIVQISIILNKEKVSYSTILHNLVEKYGEPHKLDTLKIYDKLTRKNKYSSKDFIPKKSIEIISKANWFGKKEKIVLWYRSFTFGKEIPSITYGINYVDVERYQGI